MSRFAVLPARAVEDSRLSRTHLRALAALCTYTDKNGWAWPSCSTISATLGVSRQMVSRCLHDLEAWHFVEIRAQVGDDGRQRANLYRVRFDFGEPVAPPATSEVAPPATSRGCTNAPVNAPGNAAAERDAAAIVRVASKPRGCVTRAGVKCWNSEPGDLDLVEHLIAQHGEDHVQNIAAALAMRGGKPPLPSQVSDELAAIKARSAEEQREKEQRERQRREEAKVLPPEQARGKLAKAKQLLRSGASA